jgi:tetratricopeptide (TPR) repeat protein
MRCRAWLAVALLAGAPLAGARLAAATQPRGPAQPSTTVALARTHFQRGVELYRSGAYDAALAEFSRAYESAPNYRVLYNLAQTQAQRHDYVEALALFQSYLEEGAGQLSETRADEVRAEIGELERRTSRLRVDVNVDDARLFINDRPSVDLPRDEPLLLNAGIHRLRVDKPGYLSVSRTVTLAGGDDLSLTFELSPELDMDDVPAPAPPPPALPPLPPVDRTAFWTSLAATGALAGTSLTFGILTRRANADLEERLDQFPAPRSAVEAGRARVRSFALLTDVFGVAAVAALGLTTYFYLDTAAPAHEAAPASGLRAQLGLRSSSVFWVGDF